MGSESVRLQQCRTSKQGFKGLGVAFACWSDGTISRA